MSKVKSTADNSFVPEKSRDIRNGERPPTEDHLWELLLTRQINKYRGRALLFQLAISFIANLRPMNEKGGGIY